MEGVAVQIVSSVVEEKEFAMSDVLPRVITRKELRQLVPYTPQHIHRLEKKGEFPKRIKIGKRRVGWWLHEVLAWLAERSATSTRIVV